MNALFRIGPLIAAAALLGACATAEGYRQQTALWLGAPADTLMIERGAPTARERLSDGRELWVYAARQHHHVDGYMRTVPRTRTVTRRNADGETVQVTERYDDFIYEPPRQWWSECETRFVIGLDGRVEDFRFAGDACVAQEIR